MASTAPSTGAGRTVRSNLRNNIQGFRAEAERLLATLRRRLLIPDDVQIRLLPRTPRELPLAFGSCSWDYLPYRQFDIELRVDLEGRALEWILCHELWESKLATYGTVTEELIEKAFGPGGLRPNTEAALLWHHRDAYARNELVEQLVRITLGYPRPESLLALGQAAGG